METGDRGSREGGVGPLKPSLVEWKPPLPLLLRQTQLPLETFLGGMETPPGREEASAWSHLETFLGGMETDEDLGGAGEVVPLKPSLVEWKLASASRRISPLPPLETFLGGMETWRRGVRTTPTPSLKPSLVEWKPATSSGPEEKERALKPSLVEWKPIRCRAPRTSAAAP